MIDERPPSKIDRPGDRWWVSRAGRFAQDREFREIVRLGQACRKFLRKKAGS
jgi:hypothetical protein